MWPLFKYLQMNRGISTLSKLHRNHYDSLGITPKATQADVKSAYYRLSKQYHPDYNTESKEAVIKFREVTEAYEVLGNVKLRRLYDKGVDTIGGHSSIREDDDPTTKFYRARERRSRPPPPTGRTPIYDFDEWSRSHYGATFARDMQIKRRRIMQDEFDRASVNEVKTERVLICMAILGFLFMMITSSMHRDENLIGMRKDITIDSDKK